MQCVATTPRKGATVDIDVFITLCPSQILMKEFFTGLQLAFNHKINSSSRDRETFDRGLDAFTGPSITV